MIKGIYETHLQVQNLESAIKFYNRLDLKLAHHIESRGCAFFYVGQNRRSMLGLWEVPKGSPVKQNHFAFEVSLEDLKQSITWLRGKGIEPITAFGKEPLEPIVHTWMPAASVYFNDIDGNSLELISLLEGEPQIFANMPYLSEWLEHTKK